MARHDAVWKVYEAIVNCSGNTSTAGGTLLFLPSPYEDSNQQEWTAMGRVCTEFVRFMTTSNRGFEAAVRDHYTTVLETAPYTQPAICLGTDPRFKRTIQRRPECLVPGEDACGHERHSQTGRVQSSIGPAQGEVPERMYFVPTPGGPPRKERATSQEEARTSKTRRALPCTTHPYGAARGASESTHKVGKEGTFVPDGHVMYMTIVMVIVFYCCVVLY
ncbi:unnamed protein product [Haemonchus placei]|uniref:Retrotransposon protein n=1 Tax=Haemonchus placei TaxID=6290 RepID=A0A0N4WUP9_HAEPC|nr:unnamed protein product [Haemonchus placei]